MLREAEQEEKIKGVKITRLAPTVSYLLFCR